MKPESKYHRPIERETWFRAMPGVNWSMAKPYALREPGELRLLRTEDLEWSRSGSRRMVFL